MIRTFLESHRVGLSRILEIDHLNVHICAQKHKNGTFRICLLHDNSVTNDPSEVIILHNVHGKYYTT